MELFRIHNDLTTINFKTPIGDRAKLWRQTEEHEQVIERHATNDTIVTRHTDFGQLAVRFFKARHLTDFKLHFPVFAKFLHLGNGGAGCAEAVTTVNEDYAFGLADQIERPVERRVTTTADDDVLAGKEFGILHVVVKLGTFKLLDARHAQALGLEATDAGCDKDRLRHEARALIGFHVEATVFFLTDRCHFLTQMELRTKRVDLLEKIFREFTRRANRYGGDVIDGLMLIELHALTAHLTQGVNNVSLDFQKTQFKHLEQTDGTGTNDDGIRFNDFVCLRSKGQIIFNSHDEIDKKGYKKFKQPLSHKTGLWDE